ncbi:MULTISPECIES: hypothetical protein [Tsukamurella]|uniref:Uncharacterized protein n=1 Tax=Tsukamurella strandjordii TaxID=147577 RepID=A0AA90NKT3_9ACTN|nr:MULTISPECIES: hypothetical protein [Tsukamurella]MDP0400241.1 hypothetical protein [Tsukamurella strandjordii]GIZ98519.1 hypothetical protein TTY48_31310 [Tsukamurella sp. TY48]
MELIFPGAPLACALGAAAAWLVFVSPAELAGAVAREAAGWIAITLATLAILPLIALVLGLLLLDTTGEVEASTAVAVAITATVAACAAALYVGCIRRVRFLAVPIFAFGAGVPWFWWFLLVGDWSFGPT